jgi:hypothetical protein
MTNIPGQLVFLVIFSCVAIIIILFIRNRHKEKIELIKKGDSTNFHDISEYMKLNSLGRGIIFISMALGVLVGHLLTSQTELSDPVCYIGSVLLFFGIGSLLFYFILRKR